MSKRKQFFSFFVMVTAIFLFIPTAHSVMPPEIYAEQAKASRIKAIAIIKDVEVTDVGRYYSSKRVTFTLDYANVSATPGIFTGICKSVDTSSQQMEVFPGGNIYHYPHVNERVYVTISENGGFITSMTGISPELEDTFRNDPGRVIYTFGKAYAQEKGAPPIPTPVIRGKEPASEDQIPAMSLFDDPGKDQKSESQSYGHGDIEAAVPPQQPAGDIQGQFIMALGNDDMQETRRFINMGANVNGAISQTGQTPLMFAESRSMAELLVKRGADVKATDLKGDGVLHYAVTRKDAVALIRFFTSLGADPNLRGWLTEPSIFNACRYFHETRAFNNSHVTDGDNADDHEGPDPRATLTALVHAGTDINIRDNAGNTLLMSAVTWDNRTMVLLLLELGADKNLDKDGRTARDMAYDMGHRAIYQVLE